MSLKELLEINEIVFGVEKPKIRPFFGRIEFPQGINNLLNKFIFTGIPNCQAYDLYGGSAIDFGYYFNIGDFLGDTYEDDPLILILEFLRPVETIGTTLQQVPLKLTSNSYTIKGSNNVDQVVPVHEFNTLLTLSNTNASSGADKGVRFYLLEYDQTKIMKI